MHRLQNKKRAGGGGRLCGSASLVDARQLFVLTGLQFSTFSCYCSASATSLAKKKEKKRKKTPPPNVVDVGEHERKVWKLWSDVCLFSYLVIKAFIERTCFIKIKLGYPDMMDVRLTLRLTSEEPYVLDGSFLGSWPSCLDSALSSSRWEGGKEGGGGCIDSKCSLVFTQRRHTHVRTYAHAHTHAHTRGHSSERG